MKESAFTELTALDTFKTWAADGQLAIIALHTTDLKGEALECAIIGAEGETLYDSRFKPGRPIHPGAWRVHGISESDVSAAPVFADEWPRIRDILAERHVIAWAPDFLAESMLRSLGGEVPPQSPEFWALSHSSRSVIDAFSYIAGKPGRGGGFSFVKLEDAYQGIGKAVPDAPRSARVNALMVLSVICWTSTLTPENLPHLLPVPEVTSTPPGEELESRKTPQLEAGEAPAQAHALPAPEGAYQDTEGAVQALIAAGLIVRERDALTLPDESFSLGMRELLRSPVHPGEVHTGRDRLCQAACELWLRSDGRALTLSQAVRYGFEQTYYACLCLGSELRDVVEIDRQRAPGLALVNLLSKAGLAHLAAPSAQPEAEDAPF